MFLAGLTGMCNSVTRLTLKKPSVQLFLACDGVLEYFAHFKHSQNKPQESQKSKNVFPYFPMIQQEEIVCLNLKTELFCSGNVKSNLVSGLPKIIY